MGIFGPPNIEKMKAKNNVKGLIKALSYQKDWEVRKNAAKALSAIGEPAVEPLIAALEEVIRHGDDAFIDNAACLAAADALGRIGDARAVEPLIVALKYIASNVRMDIAEALGNIGKSAVEPLIAALKDKDSDVPLGAADALGRIGDARAVKPLIAKLKQKKVRQTAAEALVKIGSPAVEPLIAIVKDWSSYERIRFTTVARVLGKIGDTRAVEPLIAVLKDGSRDVRLVAAKTLEQLGWKPDEGEAGACYWIALQEYERVGALGASAVDPLITALRDTKNWEVRKAVAEALGRTGDALAVDPLITVQKEGTSPYIIHPAAVALGAIGKPAVEPLIAALKDDEYWEVRKDVAEALGAIGDPRAVDPLITALRDMNWYVYDYAVDVLDRLGWKPDAGENGAWYWIAKREFEKAATLGSVAVEPLIAFIKNDNKYCVDAAAKALDRLGWKPDAGENGAWYWIAKRKWKKASDLGSVAVEPLIAFIRFDYNDRDERKAAARTLVKMYQEETFDESSKRRILAAREAIVKPHYDTMASCGHTDRGIGVKFPL